jgi:peptide deformylase
MAEPQLMDIVLYPDPFLNKAARAVTAEELKAGVADGWNLADLVERMKATMYANEGVGLAAPQVRVGLRLFVADPAKDKTGFFAIFNPKFSELKGSIVDEEGCLSIPGVRAKVKRSKALVCSGLDLKGEPISFDASELLARVCQHENDHLDGVLFISKIGMTARYSTRKKLEELEEDYKAMLAAAKRKKAHKA